ncbi:hypothetical protein O3P69_014300 [Scylla paramamosain]|uniref:Reverse transcriptase RNase H-like domain-containing protein n=1 Tax=Scylla paramamosain TaxID=85552 RepID=A0AAW0TDU6_SCYPA
MLELALKAKENSEENPEENSTGCELAVDPQINDDHLLPSASITGASSASNNRKSSSSSDSSSNSDSSSSSESYSSSDSETEDIDTDDSVKDKDYIPSKEEEESFNLEEKDADSHLQWRPPEYVRLLHFRSVLECPAAPGRTQFETFLVSVGGNDFTATWKALLLHSVVAEAPKVFHSQPPAIKATGEDDYADAMRQLRCFCSSQVNDIAERFNFRHRRQRCGESTAEYVAELRQLAHNCQFGALAEEMIRDQVVEKSAYPANRQRKRFLYNKKLTLCVVVTQAEAYERSMRESQEMREPAYNTSNFTHEEASWEVQKTTAFKRKRAQSEGNYNQTLRGRENATPRRLHPTFYATGEVFAVEHGPVTTQLRVLPAIKGYQHKIVLEADATPVRHKLRRLLLSVRKEVSTELQNLVEQAIIERIDASELAAIRHPRLSTLLGRHRVYRTDVTGARRTLEVDNEEIVGRTALMAYKPQLLTIVTTDASDKGIGAVLSQKDDSGKERAVLFWSRQLTPSEQKYYVSERETLVAVCAVERWKLYLWGRFLKLRTDHSALTKILSSRYSERAGTRVARWQAHLIPYSYEVEYVPGSREEETENAEERKEEYKIVALLDDGDDAITNQEIQEAASTDEEILTLKECLRQGFPELAKQCPQVIRPYFQFRHELSEVSGIVLQAWLGGPVCIVMLKTSFGNVASARRTTRYCHRGQLQHPFYPCNCQANARRSWESTWSGTRAPASSRYAITMVDYRSKWAEVVMTGSSSENGYVTTWLTTAPRPTADDPEAGGPVVLRPACGRINQERRAPCFSKGASQPRRLRWGAYGDNRSNSNRGSWASSTTSNLNGSSIG